MLAYDDRIRGDSNERVSYNDSLFRTVYASDVDDQSDR